MTAPPTLDSLGLAALPVDQRLALADQLWDSVAAELADQPLSDAQLAELDRRVALADADPSRGTPWEQVRAAARARWAT